MPLFRYFQFTLFFAQNVLFIKCLRIMSVISGILHARDMERNKRLTKVLFIHSSSSRSQLCRFYALIISLFATTDWI